jgi:hypothetical protein
MIFVGHAPDNVLRPFTLHRFAMFDAADVFVLLAGYAAGLVYGRAMDRDGWGTTAWAALRRAWAVYVAHLMTFLLLVALAGRFGAASHVDAMRLAPLVAQPLDALWQALLLRYQPFTMDILPTYVVILVLLAFVLPLLRRPAPLIGAAVGCWAVAWLAGYNPAIWPAGGWNLNPLAWQLLFLTRAALGYRPPGGAPRSVPWDRRLFLACVVLLISLRPLYALRWDPDLLAALLDGSAHLVWALPERDPDFKTFQHPLQVLSLLAMAYVAGHLVPREAGWLHRRRAAPFLLMGQHGLPVFCTTVAASFVAQRLIEGADGGPAVQAGVNLGGLALLVAVAVVANRLRTARVPTARGPAAGAGTGRPGSDRVGQ